ncbi:hypothetical protein DY467_07460 [Rhodopseudomonas sp. BR0G17]|nr:hypothetical protein [Rhodopseudomonas sp. BR0G17]
MTTPQAVGRLCHNATLLIVGGVKFDSYKTGINDFERRSADGRICLRRCRGASTYVALVDGAAIKNGSGKPKRFQTQTGAAAAAVALISKRLDVKK